MCTCGEIKPHVIMRRNTFDGLEVCLWDDGAVTGALGTGLSGVPVRRPRTPEQTHRARVAGRLMLGEISIRERADLPDLYRASEKAAKLDAMPGTVRRLFAAAQKPATPRLVWTVLHADTRGQPTERVCRLPRMWWPGYVVFDFCGSVGSSRGRYVLMQDKRRDGTCTLTGFSFPTLRALGAHLADMRAT